MSEKGGGDWGLWGEKGFWGTYVRQSIQKWKKKIGDHFSW